MGRSKLLDLHSLLHPPPAAPSPRAARAASLAALAAAAEAAAAEDAPPDWAEEEPLPPAGTAAGTPATGAGSAPPPLPAPATHLVSGSLRLPRDRVHAAAVAAARRSLHDDAWAAVAAFHAALLAAVRPTAVDPAAMVAEAVGGPGTAARRRVARTCSHPDAGGGVPEALAELLLPLGGAAHPSEAEFSPAAGAVRGLLVGLMRAALAADATGRTAVVSRDAVVAAAADAVAPFVAPRVAAECGAIAEAVRRQGVLARRRSAAEHVGGMLRDAPLVPPTSSSRIRRATEPSAASGAASAVDGGNGAAASGPRVRLADTRGLTEALLHAHDAAPPPRESAIGPAMGLSAAASLLTTGAGLADALRPVKDAAAALALAWEAAHPAAPLPPGSGGHTRAVHGSGGGAAYGDGSGGRGIDVRQLAAALRLVASPLALPHELMGMAWALATWAPAFPHGRPPTREESEAACTEFAACAPAPPPAFAPLVRQACARGPCCGARWRQPPPIHWPSLRRHTEPPAADAAHPPALAPQPPRPPRGHRHRPRPPNTIAVGTAVATAALLCTRYDAYDVLHPLVEAALAGSPLTQPRQQADRTPARVDGAALAAVLASPQLLPLLAPARLFERRSRACSLETVLAFGPPGHIDAARAAFCAHAAARTAEWARHRSLVTAAWANWRLYTRRRRGLRRVARELHFRLAAVNCPGALRAWRRAAAQETAATRIQSAVRHRLARGRARRVAAAATLLQRWAKHALACHVRPAARRTARRALAAAIGPVCAGWAVRRRTRERLATAARARARVLAVAAAARANAAATVVQRVWRGHVGRTMARRAAAVAAAAAAGAAPDPRIARAVSRRAAWVQQLCRGVEAARADAAGARAAAHAVAAASFAREAARVAAEVAAEVGRLTQAAERERRAAAAACAERASVLRQSFGSLLLELLTLARPQTAPELMSEAASVLLFHRDVAEGPWEQLRRQPPAAAAATGARDLAGSGSAGGNWLAMHERASHALRHARGAECGSALVVAACARHGVEAAAPMADDGARDVVSGAPSIAARLSAALRGNAFPQPPAPPPSLPPRRVGRSLSSHGPAAVTPAAARVLALGDALLAYIDGRVRGNPGAGEDALAGAPTALRALQREAVAWVEARSRALHRRLRMLSAATVDVDRRAATLEADARCRAMGEWIGTAHDTLLPALVDVVAEADAHRAAARAARAATEAGVVTAALEAPLHLAAARRIQLAWRSCVALAAARAVAVGGGVYTRVLVAGHGGLEQLHNARTGRAMWVVPWFLAAGPGGLAMEQFPAGAGMATSEE